MTNFAAQGLVLWAESPASFWLPPKASTIDGVDHLFYFILYVSAFFFVLIVGLMVYFVIAYRRRPGVAPQESPSHSTALELFWTAIPLLIVVYIFYEGFTSYLDMRNAPRNALEIRVVAKKWNWEFFYRNGASDAELHVPVGEPVRLVMESKDVIHSLFIPPFRIKSDLVPGRYTSTWFQATEPGTFGLYCTEYCGTKHSQMLSKVVVHERGEFEQWLEEAANFMDRMTPVEAGELLYDKKGCKQCHSIDGTRLAGPTFKGLWQSERRFTNADPVTAEENYIRESILNPRAKIVEGYQPVMPTYQGSLKDEEIGAIIEYLKTLK